MMEDAGCSGMLLVPGVPPGAGTTTTDAGMEPVEEEEEEEEELDERWLKESEPPKPVVEPRLGIEPTSLLAVR